MNSETASRGLSRDSLTPELREKFERLQADPVTILQVGEGNFLRGFFDWMIQECRDLGLYRGAIAVTQPRPGGSAKLQTLKSQDGLYNVVVRGRENGESVERRQTIAVFKHIVDPYAEWEAFLKLAESPDLEFVVSNTTEAGLSYQPEALDESVPILSYPGKMTLFLYRRYLAFGGAEDKGLVFLPCELVEDNGDVLRGCMLKHCEAWGLPEAFIRWVIRHNRFLNTLVDRIVTGYPHGEAEDWFAEWGYRDALLTTAEPYHFWAIEAEPDLGGRLPLRQAGLNVQWVSDLAPLRLRKVRMLNGAHTFMAPLGILRGFLHVREALEDPDFGGAIRSMLEEEIIPSIPLPAAELQAYARELYERFRNPYIEHRLSDIAMNSTSKFRVRLLPSLLHYAERRKPLPKQLVRALAGLLRYGKVALIDGEYRGTSWVGEAYVVKDDPAALAAFEFAWHADGGSYRADTARRLLGLEHVWGTNLASVPGLADAVASEWEAMERL